MKLLILTQKVDENDDVLGFFVGWLEEFAKHCEKVTVVCLEKGDYDLPENVKVLSLGKEKPSRGKPVSATPDRSSRRSETKWSDGRGAVGGKRSDLWERTVTRLRYTFNFYKHSWRERKNYDTVFVHMNPEYVVLGGLFWKLWRKKIALWYAHGSVNLKLRLAEKLTDKIFTSTESGFRLASEKKRVVGQGIDTEKFKPATVGKMDSDVFKIISIGRISPVKDYETLIGATEILAKKGLKLSVDIVGGEGLPNQKSYFSDLKEVVAQKNLSGIVNFIGAVSNKDITRHLQSADLFVNMSHTGSLDKAVLEAMACGLPVLTCNEALKGLLGEYEEKLMYPKKDLPALAREIEYIINLGAPEKEKISSSMRNIVAENYRLGDLIKKLSKELTD